MLRRSAVGATAVNLDAGHVTVLDRGTGSEYDEPFDFHLLATGAQAVRPDLPGSQAPNVFVLRHYDDGVAIAAFLRDQRPRHVTIVGGGYIGLELAEAPRSCSRPVDDGGGHGSTVRGRAASGSRQVDMRSYPLSMSSVPDLESLRLLVLIGEWGSIGKAATELGVAQPSASKRMSTLERRLGLTLVDRTRRGSSLTPAGRVVCGWAQRVLEELDGLLTGAEALRTKRNAELRVAASMTVAEHLATIWIGELRQARPQLYVGLQVTNSETVTEFVRAGEVDVGFTESPAPPHGLSTRRVAVDRLVVVIAPSHPWVRRRRPLTTAELLTVPLVVRERGSGTRETVDRALLRAGAGQVVPLVELGSAAAVRAAVIAGTGPAAMSELAVASDLADGRLVEVTVEGLDLRRTLRAVWPAGRRLVGPAAELVAAATRGR